MMRVDGPGEGAARLGYPLAILRGTPVVAARAREYLAEHRAFALIGASAVTHGFGVVTNKEIHFRRIEGLHVENWLKP